MAEALIETTHLRKSYVSRRGRRIAVNDLNLRVEAGGVHGFLGPNGSGKTTTIRLVLGLARPDSGEIRLCGESIPNGIATAMAQVGAVVEQPRLFPGFSGRINLTLLAKSVGLGKDDVDAALRSVGMLERADDRYGAYSLGMKQRLAIAGAMLKHPRLLILDEPTNGLDPSGIREIRTLVKTLAAGGTTVLISSHILAEVQQVCDSVTIIGRGAMLASGPVEQVLSSVAQGGRTYAVGVADPESALAALTAAGMDAQRDGEALQVNNVTDPSLITKVLAAQGQYLSRLTPIGGDLESAYLEITEGKGLA